jgi:hypothetical protein
VHNDILEKSRHKHEHHHDHGKHGKCKSPKRHLKDKPDAHGQKKKKENLDLSSSEGKTHTHSHFLKHSEGDVEHLKLVMLNKTTSHEIKFGGDGPTSPHRKSQRNSQKCIFLL